ncbi:hypothetical protein N9L26_00010 [Candidatus Pacebacteria bacterium]|nr:hypothetical protein [Candidatus Paceibacterota bacterium]
MEILTALMIIVYNIAISLGVGASSIVIASFVVALWDKNISADERAMLGVIYVTLRIAMVAILLTVAYLSYLNPEFSSVTQYIWALLIVLYGNAILMTLHKISSKIGPALQAATWYTLGTIVTVDLFSLYEVTWLNFGILYAVFIAVAIAVVNAFMKYIFSRPAATKS